jgi:branched-chain amino acid transport system permease protein
VVIWAVLLLALWTLHNLLDSREGRAIRALKGGRLMAESMGVDTARHRIKLFVLARCSRRLSGWLYAHLQRFVNPTPFNLNIGIEMLFMAVVGGAGHLWGAVLGATLITLLKEKLQDVLPALLGTSGNFEVIVFGLLMLFVLQRFRGRPVAHAGAARSSRWVRADASEETRRLHRTRRVLPAQLAQRTPCRLPANCCCRPDDVSKRFGGLVANNEISMTLKAGEIHALIGPNGAGKSTFFNMISGVDDPSFGRGAADGPVHGDQALARLRGTGPGPHLPACAPAGPAQRGRERGARRAPARQARLARGDAAA